MSWLFSQALVAEYSVGTFSDGEPSAPLNGNHTQQAYLSHGKTTGFSRLSRFGMTCRPLTDAHGEALLMSYLAAFRVRTSAQQEKALASTESDQECGSTWRGLLAKYNPVSCSWKTAQFSLLEDSGEFSETWPRWGLMRNGESYLRRIPELRTYGSESGLWPTHVASDTGSRTKRYAQGGIPLSLAVKLYPTPTTMKSSGGAALCKWGGAGARKKMATMVSHTEMNGPLNPEWVEWLMGWPQGWTDLTALAMDRFREWQQQHSACCPELEEAA